VPSIRIAPKAAFIGSDTGSNIDVQVEGTNDLDERPVVSSAGGTGQTVTTQTAAVTTTVKQTQSYRKYTLGQRGTAFKYASADLTDNAKKELTGFLAALKNKKYNMIYIGGHTDSSGDEPDNVRLSEARALAVADFFAANGGVPREKMTYKGYGSKYPLASNATAAGRAKNRRVDILVR